MQTFNSTHHHLFTKITSIFPGFTPDSNLKTFTDLKMKDLIDVIHYYYIENC
jgi:hypothetical protein